MNVSPAIVHNTGNNSRAWLIPIYLSICSIILDFSGVIVSSSKINYASLFIIIFLVLANSQQSIGFSSFGRMKLIFFLFLFYASFLSTYMKILLNKPFSYMSIFFPQYF